LVALAVGASACVWAAGAGGQGDAEKARQLLLKTLERNFKQNVIALISQRGPTDSESFQRIQVQISRDGKMRQTVIYPLSMQGVETIDDGRQSATYLPDENLILVQESSRLLPNDTVTRINLTVKNYSLSLTGTSKIAGQLAAVVTATPRSRIMERRRYYIDQDTGFLLQLETIDSGGTPRIAFRTQQVSYPPKISNATFKVDLDSREDQKIVYRRRTGLFDGVVKATPSIGFEPVLPKELPHGFQMQDAQINDSGNYRSIAVRITDGLVKGTVYQYSTSTAKNLKAMPGTTVGDAAGVRFFIAADIPEAAREQILEAFVEAARKGAYLSDPGPTAFLELSPVLHALTR
jgi:outer membrane lipoprotein-sorting protein